jgi:hypothetical protein
MNKKPSTSQAASRSRVSVLDLTAEQERALAEVLVTNVAVEVYRQLLSLREGSKEQVAGCAIIGNCSGGGCDIIGNCSTSQIVRPSDPNREGI